MKIEFVSKLNVPDFISKENLATFWLFSVLYEHSEPRFIPTKNDIYTAYSGCNPQLGALMHTDLLSRGTG